MRPEGAADDPFFETPVEAQGLFRLSNQAGFGVNDLA
jgi:hypothetical protein